METPWTGICAFLLFEVCFSLRVFTSTISNQAFPLARKGLTVTNITQLRFKLKACGPAHLILQKEDRVDFNTYGSWTFVLGSGGNARSEIRSAVFGPLYDPHYEALLDCNEFRPFWIRWKGGMLELGKGSEFGTDRISLHTIAPVEFNYAFLVTGWGKTGCWDVDTGLTMLASTWKKLPGNTKLFGAKVFGYHTRSPKECNLKCVISTEDYLPCGCVEYSYNKLTKQCLVVDESDDVILVDEASWKTWKLM
ncbi:hypothetical protein SNE40_017375 [Patella caerulea]|uniref:Farnesoic acid O-methyl transferase domain-containing protein n=1 Tax=Patella caerulea TaxID=87958 RepID=A0AAN8JH73_PATCE